MFFRRVDEESELRMLEERHAPELFRLTLANRDHLIPWLPWVDHVRTIQDTLEFIVRGRSQYEKNEGFQAGIWYRGSLIGTIGFHGLNRYEDSINIGYWLAKEFQGKGIVTRACRVLIEYAFTHLGLKRVEIRCAPDNQKSRAIPIRLGFIEEGIRDQPEQGSWFGPLVVYGLSVSQWREQNPENYPCDGQRKSHMLK